MGEACASGGRVRDPRCDGPDDPPSHLCPQVEHAPHSWAGQRLLDLIKRGTILRRGFAGVDGIDMEEARRRLPDVPDHELNDLIDAAEAGLFAGLAVRQSRKAGGGGAHGG